MRRKEFTHVKHPKDKQYKYLWSKMQQTDVIIQAWKNLRKGKTKRVEVKAIDKNLDAEVERMRQMIKETTPEHPER